MAQPSYQFLLASFILALSFSVAFTSKPKYAGLKSLHFSLYEQEIFNKTAFIIVRGVDTDVPLIGSAAQPFGTFFAFNDPMTVSPDRTSEVVGSIEGMAAISALDGLQTTQAIRVKLSYKNHKGSISLTGVTPSREPGDLVVVGGTGDFLFVQGYVSVIPYNLSSPFLTYTNEFHLYWPPYATSN